MVRIAMCIGLLICIQLLGNAQTNDTQHFLKKIGLTDSLYSETLEEYREIYIQLPTNYNPEKNQKYPVVYILDGEVLLPTVSNVQDFYNGGFTPEMVLVGISNNKHRTRDLTTSTIDNNDENGEAENFSNFIETELIPFIENKYQVNNFRTLIGHSYGGLFTIYTLINHPQLFSNYIAIDPSLDWDDQKLVKEAQGLLATQNYENKSMFMSLSEQLHMQNPNVTIDNVMQDTSNFTLFSRSNIAFSNLVMKNTQNGLSFDWKFYPRDLHGTIPFPSIMDGMISVFEWYQMENTDKFNSPETSKEELADIVNYRANKLERYFNHAVAPYPEDLFNALGYMSLDMGQVEKSKMFFEFAIKYYQYSANTYDSMADYYERNKDFDSALKFVTKAYKISGNDYYKQRVEDLKKISRAK